MVVLGIVGWSGSGKTSLIERLLPDLIGRGLKVSTIKRSHHGVDLDTEGKDSWRHRQAGAHETMVASPRRWALMREAASEEESSLPSLLTRMAKVDLVLVEGFSQLAHDKIEVWRAEAGKPLRQQSDRHLLAIAMPAGDAAPALPASRLDLDRPDQIADFIVRHYRLAR